MLSTMIVMLCCLTFIISVYCCIRLMEMMSSNAVSKFRMPWALLCVAGIAVIACSCVLAIGVGRDSALGGQELFNDFDTTLPKPLSRP